MLGEWLPEINNIWIISAIIIVCLIILFYVINRYSHKSFANEFLEGVWNADDEYLGEAGLTELVLYIGELDNGSDRNAWIVMKSEDNILKNNKIQLNITPCWSFNSGNVYKFNVASDDLSDMFDGTVTLSLNIVTGLLAIHDDDNLYMELYKNNILSEVSKT